MYLLYTRNYKSWKKRNIMLFRLLLYHNLRQSHCTQRHTIFHCLVVSYKTCFLIFLTYNLWFTEKVWNLWISWLKVKTHMLTVWIIIYWRRSERAIAIFHVLIHKSLLYKFQIFVWIILNVQTIIMPPCRYWFFW